MKPKDLIVESRKIMVHDRIWLIPPKDEDAFHFQGFNSLEFFKNDKPVYLEYCSGNGLWIAEKARTNLDVNWVGVEIKFSRIRKIWSKIKNHSLSNLMGINGEAFSLTQKYLQPQSVDKIFINFPDPWPKRRHAKYRLVQMPFINEMARIVKPCGEICIVTDDAQYSSQIIKLMIKSGLFDPKVSEPHYQTEFEGYGTSYFEDLWREKKKEIRYHIFIKK